MHNSLVATQALTSLHKNVKIEHAFFPKEKTYLHKEYLLVSQLHCTINLKKNQYFYLYINFKIAISKTPGIPSTPAIDADAMFIPIKNPVDANKELSM